MALLIIFVSLACAAAVLIQRGRAQRLHLEVGRAHERSLELELEVRRLETKTTELAEALAQVSRRHETILELIPVGVVESDPSGGIVRINAAGQDLVSEHRAELVGAHPLLRVIRDCGPASGLEVAFSTPSGPRLFELGVSTVSADDSPPGAAVTFFRDVTRQRLLEHELRSKGSEFARQVGDLERAARHKSEFLATMSHELRTPLNAVIGFTDVLLDGTYGDLNPMQRQFADDVIDAGRHLLALINDVLDLSKIEAGRLDLSLHTIDLAEAAADAVKLIRPQAATDLIHLENLVPDGVFFVRADLDRVRQVLVNLVSNAVKFTPKGGHVRVQGAVVGGFVRISVTDTGVGIAETDRDKLFREFSQVDGSVTRRFGGTGLGLAISRRIVTMHGGHIDFTSRVGEGSTFWIDLPLPPRATPPTFSRGAAKMRRALGQTVDAKDGPTVLVLDEDPASQRLFESALGEAGFRVACAGRLAEAQELALLPSIEVIVVDPSLADASAEEVDRFVTERFGARVVVSSLGSRSEVTRGLPQALFVSKPIDRVRLLARVRVARRLESPRFALLVEPNDDDASNIRLLVADAGFEILRARTIAEARAHLGARPAFAVVELVLPDGDGTSLIDELSAAGAAVLVLTGRDLEGHERDSLRTRARWVAQKGHLSRDVFSEYLSAVSQRRKRVLAVDDNELNLRLLTTLLSGRGYEVIEARTAASALDLARTMEPDVILMDLRLPDRDGLSVTRELKAHDATKAIPILAVTAQAMAGDAERARAAGCADHIPKPIDRNRLLQAIERALG